jgi:hypothetical protein
MTSTKRALDKLKEIWITTRRYDMYKQLINAIEKLVHEMWGAKDLSDVRSK